MYKKRSYEILRLLITKLENAEITFNISLEVIHSEWKETQA